MQGDGYVKLLSPRMTQKCTHTHTHTHIHKASHFSIVQDIVDIIEPVSDGLTDAFVCQLRMKGPQVDHL